MRYRDYSDSKPELVKDETFAARFDRLLALPDFPAAYIKVISDFKTYNEKKGGLTPPQVKYFLSIEGKFDEDKQAAKKTWESSWDEEKARRFRIVCAYYVHLNQYFLESAKRGLADEKYIPSEATYSKMVENKYSVRVIAAHDDAPKFEVGSYVRLSLSFLKGSFAARKLATVNDVFMVIKNADLPVASAAAGAKPYQVMKLDNPAVILSVEERELCNPGKKLVEI